MLQNHDKLRLTDRPEGAALAVKAVPGASRDRIAGVLGDCLKIAVAAAAEKGKANKAVTALLAEALHLPEADVEILSGQTNPRKEFLLRGLSAEEARRRLANLR